jgi:AmiR/NasT family two-component response regulator
LLLEEHASDDALVVAAERVVRSEPTSTATALKKEDPATELEHMRKAMESRAVIEQAKGIAMERYGLAAETAWSWLVRTSQDSNKKLREVARELVESSSRSRDVLARPGGPMPSKGDH